MRSEQNGFCEADKKGRNVKIGFHLGKRVFFLIYKMPG